MAKKRHAAFLNLLSFIASNPLCFLHEILENEAAAEGNVGLIAAATGLSGYKQAVLHIITAEVIHLWILVATDVAHHFIHRGEVPV